MTTIPSRARRLTAAAILVTALTACGTDDDLTVPLDAQDEELAAEFELVMDDGLDFEPEVLTVPAGSTIGVVNLSSRAHTVTSDDDAPAAFDTGPVPEGDTVELSFDEPGRYPYHCELHPDVMQGVIVVE